MYKLTVIIVFVFISKAVFAAGPPVVNQFVTGEPIIASEINDNFQELADRIQSVADAVSALSSGLIWNMSAEGVTDGKSLNVFTVPADGEYVLTEILRTNSSSSCTIDSGTAIIEIPRGNSILSLSTGVVLQAGDTVSVRCTTSAVVSGYAVTISGLKYRLP